MNKATNTPKTEARRKVTLEEAVQNRLKNVSSSVLLTIKPPPSRKRLLRRRK